VFKPAEIVPKHEPNLTTESQNSREGKGAV